MNAIWSFAKNFDLPIVVVVQSTKDEPAFGFTGEGIAINSRSSMANEH